ncbi:hypothetical protein AO716_06530 [Arthrobacter sp. Edens01]|nr:hypothetical protein AO716_06530 [Arthrobacter sp. Edens01]
MFLRAVDGAGGSLDQRLSAGLARTLWQGRSKHKLSRRGGFLDPQEAGLMGISQAHRGRILTRMPFARWPNGGGAQLTTPDVSSGTAMHWSAR